MATEMQVDDPVAPAPVVTAAAATTDSPSKAKKAEGSVVDMVQFPLARVRRIMKEDPDVDTITQESVFMVAAATELFVKHLVQKAHETTKKAKRKTMFYEDLATTVDTRDELEFLLDVVPLRKKVT